MSGVGGHSSSPAVRPRGTLALETALAEHRQGRIAAAAAGYRGIIAAAPDSAEALYLLGVAESQQGGAPHGARIIGRALALNPGHAEARYNRASALGLAGASAEAMAEYRRCLVLAPMAAEAHLNLGNLQAIAREATTAVLRFRRTLALAPGRASARESLGNALRLLRRWEEAVVAFEHVLRQAPDLAAAHEKLADALAALRRIAPAECHARRALALSPSSSGALFTAAVLRSLRSLNRLSVRGYRRVLAVDPSHVHAHSNLIFDQDLLPDIPLAAHQAERRRWYDRHGRRFAPASPVQILDRRADRRLRVGYVSADFRQHSAAYIFGPILLNHDRSAVEVHLYSGVAEEDDMTARFRAAADRYHATAEVSDDGLASRIRADRIDILVDLAGHSDGNRLPVFARKPAPIQLTGWGHAHGTGVETVDYLLGDPVMVPREDRGLFAESILDLPCFLAYGPPDYAPQVSPLPESGRQVILGSLNRTAKLSSRTVDLWARLLREMQEARLLLKDASLSNEQERARLLAEFAGRGVAAERLILRQRTPHAEHLATYGAIHVALDPFPQNGGVSTFEALYMGVPVVARLGNTPPGRAAAAILSSLGLDAWIGGSDDAYLDIAKQLARDRAVLERTRETLRPRLKASIVCDPTRYARAVEAAYRDIWRKKLRDSRDAGAPEA
ncbi:MAG: tetratricopeptide repeat protein [Alphaproteobacteria bacterium]|nr:tetratricopeptide repeat protein [Alphaproteobacteria bacterium]